MTTRYINKRLRRDDGSTLLLIDDTNSRLSYAGQWTASYINGTSSGNVSVHTSTTSGSTVKFAFNGTFVAVYGVIDGAPVTASFTLDGNAPIAQGVQPPDSSPYDYPFYSTVPPVDPGLHELTITVIEGAFNLDYLQYTTLSGLDNIGSSSQTQGATSLSSSSVSSAGFSSSDSSVSLSHSLLSAGAIAGIAIAGAVILIAVTVAVFFVRRRSSRRVRHTKLNGEKTLDIIYESTLDPPPSSNRRLGTFRQLGRIYRPTPARSAQSSKTATSSAPTSITQSSAMFTSVIMLSPALSMVSEESGQQDGSHHV